MADEKKPDEKKPGETKPGETGSTVCLQFRASRRSRTYHYAIGQVADVPAELAAAFLAQGAAVLYVPRAKLPAAQPINRASDAVVGSSGAAGQGGAKPAARQSAIAGKLPAGRNREAGSPATKGGGEDDAKQPGKTA